MKKSLLLFALVLLLAAQFHRIIESFANLIFLSRIINIIHSLYNTFRQRFELLNWKTNSHFIVFPSAHLSRTCT